MLGQGVHPKIVSERLGHASVNITLDTYSHVLPGLQEAAAAQLDTRVRRAAGARRPVSNPLAERETAPVGTSVRGLFSCSESWWAVLGSNQ